MSDLQPTSFPTQDTVASSHPPVASTRPVSETDVMSTFEQQLPLTGEFVSQAAETRGSARIELREDGTAWVVLTDFTTGPGLDLRLYLIDGPLVRDADGHWVAGPSSFQYEVAQIDPALAEQEIEVPAAGELPQIQTLTIKEYAVASFGSVALS